MRRVIACLAVLVMVATSCGKATNSGLNRSPSPSASGEPSASEASATVTTGTATPCTTGKPCGPPPSSASPSPAQTSTTTAAQRPWTLRYMLLGHYKNFAYCDPDYYPVARQGAEQSNADEWWKNNGNSTEASAILAHHHWSKPLTSQQRIEGYRDHKKMTVIQMDSIPGGYSYTLSISSTDQQVPDTTVKGTITNDGTIAEKSREPRQGGCPICLEGITKIATPRGAIFVRQIGPGDVVYSTDTSGHRVAVRVRRVVRRPTSGPHLMVRLALADGRVLIAAAAHPAADGRLLRDLRAGQRYDRSTISSIGYVESSQPATYDVLPATRSGDYWANGILVGSTLSA